MQNEVEECVKTIKQVPQAPPILLFPGSTYQLCDKADALLFLSLISGRNPEYLISKHVESAMTIKRSGIEVIPTGYMLIDGGSPTSVSYISNTCPIPADKPEIAVATAVAAELLGLKMIYLEAGSGSGAFVKPEMIKAVKANISIPVIVGGGINNAEAAREVYRSGADIIIIGTAVERNIQVVKEISSVKKEFNG
jgi:putative glycerol-1-phosphate prenyltransferase